MELGSAFLKGFQSLKLEKGVGLHKVLVCHRKSSTSLSCLQLLFARFAYPSFCSVWASAAVEAKGVLSCRPKGFLTTRENCRAVKLRPRPTERTGLKGDSLRFCSSPIPPSTRKSLRFELCSFHRLGPVRRVLSRTTSPEPSPSTCAWQALCFLGNPPEESPVLLCSSFGRGTRACGAGPRSQLELLQPQVARAPNTGASALLKLVRVDPELYLKKLSRKRGRYS